MISFVLSSLLLAYLAIILVLKEQWASQKPWNITIPWVNLSKCYILFLDWFDLVVFDFPYLSLFENNICDDFVQRIENALESNRNFFQIWTQRKHFLTCLSPLSLSLPSDNMNVNVVRVNVRKVLELEEMKREITNYLWWMGSI